MGTTVRSVAHGDTVRLVATEEITAPDIRSHPRRGVILVVEDRVDIRHGLMQLLELHGFEVADAAHGQSALDQLSAGPREFALVLLDLVMPGPLTGCDFRVQQLASPPLAAIPTVVVSATEADDRLRALLRPDGWLAKPFRFDDLLTVVKQYVLPERGRAFGTNG